MEKRNRNKRLLAVIFIAVLGLAATATADCGQGRGHGERRCLKNLSDGDIKKLEQERNAFFTSTKELRRELYRKDLALKMELAKKVPDPKAARKLQKEISEMETIFDQKRIDHILKMKAINPDCRSGLKKFRGKGPDRGMCYGRRDGR